MERVKLPREVAEAIEKTKTKHPTWNNHDLCYIVLNRLGYCQYEKDEDISVIHKWSNTNELKFAKALLNGYEVEQTPEEAAIQWCIKTDSIARGKSAHDVVMVIKHILKGEKTNA